MTTTKTNIALAELAEKGADTRRVTLAQLIDQYILEECPNHKGHRTEVYTLGAFLEDIRYLPYLKRKQERTQGGGQT